MTHPVNDEQLVAFLHGQLSDTEMSAVEEAINADPALAQRAEMLADQDIAIKDAFAPILDEPVPERLLSILADAPAEARVIDFGAAKARKDKNDLAKNGSGRSAWGLPQFGAMAASLAIGLFAGHAQLSNQNPVSGDAVIAASDSGMQVAGGIAKVLSGSKSGQNVKVAGLGEVNVAITFRSGDDRVCRQFAVRSGAGVDDAVACREGEQWKLEAFGRRSAETGEMRTASGEAADPVLVAVDALIAGDPLVDEAEAAALK